MCLVSKRFRSSRLGSRSRGSRTPSSGRISADKGPNPELLLSPICYRVAAKARAEFMDCGVGAMVAGAAEGVRIAFRGATSA